MPVPRFLSALPPPRARENPLEANPRHPSKLAIKPPLPPQLATLASLQVFHRGHSSPRDVLSSLASLSMMERRPGRGLRDGGAAPRAPAGRQVRRLAPLRAGVWPHTPIFTPDTRGGVPIRRGYFFFVQKLVRNLVPNFYPLFLGIRWGSRSLMKYN